MHHHHHKEDLANFIPIKEAVARLTADLEPVDTETLPIHECLGRVLAQDIAAQHSLPPFDNSSMDGYAVRARDVASASAEAPVKLRVIGEAAAGAAELPHVGEGQAARITTGAPLPPGADAVVPVEMTDDPQPMAGRELVEEVEIRAEAANGDYVRLAGQDVNQGETALEAGRKIRPQDLGMLAALGVEHPEVRRRPKVAILSTGDEVVEVDAELRPGQIRDANGYMLAGFLESAGAQAMRLGIAEDTPESVVTHLDRALEAQADLILSTAGVSMGAHDYVRQVLEEKGALSFWKVNIRPGKPMAYGEYKGCRFLGLPGNPVSAWVTFSVFVQPMLRALLGMPRAEPLMVEARLDDPVESDGRESYLRAVAKAGESGYRVSLTGSQDSGVLSSLVQANCLIWLPGGVRRVEAGSPVRVWLMGETGMNYVN